jgi:hypothetical protein
VSHTETKVFDAAGGHEVVEQVEKVVANRKVMRLWVFKSCHSLGQLLPAARSSSHALNMAEMPNCFAQLHLLR